MIKYPFYCHKFSVLKKNIPRPHDSSNNKFCANTKSLLLRKFHYRDVIQSGVENLDSGIGIYAPDAEAYNIFADLFDPIIGT